MYKYNLLDIERYIYDREKYKGAIVFAYTYKSQLLKYIGARHTWDPHHPDIKLIEDEFYEFLSRTDNLNKVVFVEGNLKAKDTSKTNANINAGEGGLVSYLASSNNVEVYCPEPEETLIKSKLLKEFTREEISTFYFLRWVSLYYKMNMRVSLEEFTNTIFLNWSKQLNWDDFDFSYENMRRISKELLNGSIDINNKKDVSIMVLPIPNKSVINNISIKVLFLRDQFILSEIEKFWKNGFSIFIVYGKIHAYTQKPALDTIVNKNR